MPYQWRLQKEGEKTRRIRGTMLHGLTGSSGGWNPPLSKVMQSQTFKCKLGVVVVNHQMFRFDVLSSRTMNWEHTRKYGFEISDGLLANLPTYRS
jgi:hypothetical protein